MYSTSCERPSVLMQLLHLNSLHSGLLYMLMSMAVLLFGNVCGATRGTRRAWHELCCLTFSAAALSLLYFTFCICFDRLVPELIALQHGVSDESDWEASDQIRSSQ